MIATILSIVALSLGVVNFILIRKMTHYKGKRILKHES